MKQTIQQRAAVLVSTALSNDKAVQEFTGKEDISYLEKHCLDKNKLPKVVPAEVYLSQPSESIRLFGFTYGFYVMPTTELIDWLRENIVGRAIEIGAGHGVIGRSLGITSTDLRLIERPQVIQWYKQTGQVIHKIPGEVKTFEATLAVRHYKPDTVIGGYITQHSQHELASGAASSPYGVKEDRLIKKVKRYIMIGNDRSHGGKVIMPEVSRVIREPWIVTRSMPDTNAIYVWDRG